MMKTEKEIKLKIIELENKLSLSRGGIKIEPNADKRMLIQIKILAFENAVMHLRWVIEK